MAYTYEQLKSMGATPVGTSYEELVKQGAKSVTETKKKPYIPTLPETGKLAPTPTGQTDKSLKEIGKEALVPGMQLKALSDLAGFGFTKATGVRPTDFGREMTNILGQGEMIVGSALGGGLVPFTKDYKQLEESRAREQEMQDKLIKTIRTNRDAGKDVKRLENLLGESLANTGASDEEINLALELTNKQILGGSAQTALDALTAGTYSAAAKSGQLLSKTAPLAKAAIPTALGQFKSGAKAMAVGGTVGYGYDVSNKLQGDELSLAPGFGTLLGAGIPMAGKVGEYFGKEQKLLRQSKKLNEIIEDYRSAVNPLKSDIKKIEIKSGKELDDMFRFMAEEEIVPKKDSNGRLDTKESVDMLKERKSDVDTLLSGSLDDTQQINDVNQIREKAKKEIAKFEKNAEILQKKYEDIDNLIDAEIQRYGRNNLTDKELHDVKNGMWSVGYDVNRATKSPSARKIGNIIKDLIEENYEGQLNIQEMNKLSGDYSNSIHLLENVHGNTVAGGKMGGFFYRMIVGYGIEKILGNIPGLRGVSFFLGQFIGKHYNDFISNPERIVAQALKEARKIKLDKRSTKILDIFEKGMKEKNIKEWDKIINTKLLKSPETIYAPEKTESTIQKEVESSGIIKNAPEPKPGEQVQFRPEQRAIPAPGQTVQGVPAIPMRGPTVFDKQVSPKQVNKKSKRTLDFNTPAVGKTARTLESTNILTEEAKILRGTKGMTADDIMKTYPNIKLKRDVPATDLYGNKRIIPDGEKLTPYELKGNKILLQDGETYIVSKSQFQNIKGQSVSAEGKPFAPELAGVEETIKGAGKWQGDEYIADGQTVANVVKNEDGSWSYQSDFSEGSDIFKTRKEAMDAALEEITDPYAETGTKYSQYQLPGGKNYKEILIKARTDFKYLKEQGAKVEKSSAGEFINPPEEFKSSHWDEPNVISHLRLNERTYKGKKVTFMEELQSDWAREARKAENINVENLPTGFKFEKVADGFQLKDGRQILGVGKTKIEAMTNAKILAKGETPTNPLLKNWQELSVKRALKEAVDNNSEYLAWTTGEQQAARYNLSTQVDNIEWYPANGVKAVKIKPVDKVNGYVVNLDNKGNITGGYKVPENWNGKQLGDVIGKGVAEKILAEPKGNLSGEGLNIGGEWAKNLYDKQVKNIVEDLTGGKVEVIDMGLPIDQKGKIWMAKSAGANYKLTPEKMKVGLEVGEGNSTYIITGVLKDGKFKAIRKNQLDETQIKKIQDFGSGKIKNITLPAISETFDISTKKSVGQQAIKITPEIKAKVKGLAPKIKTSGKQFEEKK